jgi:SAM-dependent methyltransferase
MSDAATDARPAVTPSPAAIVGAAIGFMAAKQLFAASEIGLFEALASGPLTATELAKALNLPERSCRIVADAMTALGLLTIHNDKYRNDEAAAAYLSGRDDTLDLRPHLAFWNTISYSHWGSYTDAVRECMPAPLDLTGGREATFFGGVQAYNGAHALMLAEHYDFAPHRRILDLSGLSGAFLAEALRHNPALTGTFFAEPAMVEFARAGLTDTDLQRIDLCPGEPLTGALPTGHDLVLLEHVVHRFDEADNRKLLARAREVVEPGARLLILDFYLTDGAPDRPLDALMAGEYLVIDGTVVYPESEVRAWLDETGWHWIETRPLPGSPRVLIAEAV